MTDLETLVDMLTRAKIEFRMDRTEFMGYPTGVFFVTTVYVLASWASENSAAIVFAADGSLQCFLDAPEDSPSN